MIFTDQELDEMSLIDGALALNVIIDATTPEEWIRAELDKLVADAKHRLCGIADEKSRLEALLQLFYQEWGFKGDIEQYFCSDNTQLEQVLLTRKGIPVSLGAVLLFIANAVDVPLFPVGFPTQLILKVGIAGTPTPFINPFDGEFITEHLLHCWLIGAEGALAQILPEHLEITEHSTLIGRWLAVMKGAFLREEKYDIALRCNELALTFNPEDPYEIRDRGYIFQQLNCDWVAVEDFRYFISQCPDDPAVELLKLQLNVLNAELPPLH